MSTVTQTTDFKSGLVDWLGTLTNFYCSDLKAMSHEQLTKSPGGCARSPQMFTAEVIGLMKFNIQVLNGEEPTVSEGDATKEEAAKLDSGEKMIAALQETSKQLADAINGAKDEIWGKVVTPPWQIPCPVIALTTITVNHIWYHDGQLNLIQCLNGDEKMHWEDDGGR